MNGNGTQAEPYVVGTWDEFAQVFPTAQYIELGNDIQAPDLPTNITANYLVSLDGKGYSIVNMHNASGYAFEITRLLGATINITIKDVNFNNINCQGTGFLTVGGNETDASIRLKNVTFNGNLYCDKLMGMQPYVRSNMESVGGNIHTNNARFALGTFGNTSELRYGNFSIDYGNIEPDSGYTLYSTALTAYNTKFKINAPSTGNIYFGGCVYCAFTGKGNVQINSSSGINVVEDTLNIHSSSTGTNHSLSSTDMKNIQVLYDLGFPASGVI